MLQAFALAAFFLALFWTVRRQNHKQQLQNLRFQKEYALSQQELEKERESSNRLLTLMTTLHDKKVSLTGRLPWKELAQTLVETAKTLLRVERVVLLQWDATLWELRGTAALGLSPEQFSSLHIRRGDGVLGKALQSGKIITVNSETAPAVPLAQERFLTAPYLVIPFVLQDQLGGILALSGPAEGTFDQKHIQLATLLADQAQLVMENLELYQSRELSHQEVVEALSQIGTSQDPLHPGHGTRLRFLVRAMARDLHFPNLLVDQFERGAALHDVGKIMIPETLLMKPEKLTPEEYAIVKKHPELGHQLLRPMQFLQSVAPIVLYHHEWFNGQGYPEGLAGEEIPLGARLVGIVDAWDTMTTDQPYRPALPRNAAIAELRQQAGTQFDPKLVDVFLRGIDHWEREAEGAAPSRFAAGSRTTPLTKESH